MEGSCSTGQSPQRAVVPVEEEEEESILTLFLSTTRFGSSYELIVYFTLMRKSNQSEDDSHN
jgi:hypothetical protein